ncbi:ABC transporter ATP-binding protein [Tengunoibacter tsumagoiensis]|uniref:ABC transporter ATP-binding protein n=1 Tax=Tengunoibacter tsumagoiensis TaxID=2014871 RepID=A0A402A2Y2_9CHLR|nr:ABC transporter ATP-binding protein [Tengunoibacter tsumagoiensis]GCE13507.1 ABC transporter ATP-binding protein [Tengunoibacter tsumagoiensis]
MSIVYRVEHLNKIYKKDSKKANDDLTLDIHEGEIFGLLGPNGAGKSTLVNQIAGLLKPTSGAVTLFGFDVLKKPMLIPHYVAIQQQYPAALQNLYPEEALLTTARLRGASAQEGRKATQNIMDELKINDLRKKKIRFLSGGQRQLVSVALAFIGDRPVQIFDEPTNNLDPEIRKHVWDRLLARNRQGITILLITHNVLEAEKVIQRVGIINHGRLLEVGTPGDLKARVDQRVRLELLIKSEALEKASALDTMPETTILSSQHRIILCQRDDMQEKIDYIIQHMGLDALDDFRILTPSLEDVYLQLGGGRKLD